MGHHWFKRHNHQLMHISSILLRVHLFLTDSRADDDALYNILEYNGTQDGWCIVCTREGWTRAERLKDRCEMARPHKMFKTEMVWSTCVDDGEYVDIRQWEGDQRQLFTPYLNRAVLNGSF